MLKPADNKNIEQVRKIKILDRLLKNSLIKVIRKRESRKL